GPRGVDAVLFESIVEMRSPHVAQALVAMLDVDAVIKWTTDACVAIGWLEENLAEVLRPHVEERRRQALEALPAISRKNFNEDAAAWRDWWDKTKKTLPASQVGPEGW